MNARITEILVEPATIYQKDRFKIKIKVEDPYIASSSIITEDNNQIITEDNNKLRTEWGE